MTPPNAPTKPQQSQRDAASNDGRANEPAIASPAAAGIAPPQPQSSLKADSTPAAEPSTPAAKRRFSLGRFKFPGQPKPTPNQASPKAPNPAPDPTSNPAAAQPSNPSEKQLISPDPALAASPKLKKSQKSQKSKSRSATQSVPGQATSLNAHELVLAWFKAYPGLWLSPLALGLLGGWVIAQPSPNPELASETSEAIAAPTSEPSLPDFVHRENAPLGPVSPFGEGNLIADPPDAAALAKAALAKKGLDKAAQAKGNDPTAAQINGQVAGQISAATSAPVDAKAALASRAKAQAEAFARAKANQAAANIPPQPAPPVQGNPAVDQLITMQVAIAEGDTNLTMGGSNNSAIMTLAGQPLLQLNAGKYSMQCDGSGLLLNGQKLPATVMMAPYGGGLNYVRERSYRGQIQFICQGNTVLAVNHIDMLNYLYSVVGSEVSASWPTAALQAQSVAARSYALTYYFRPAKEHFHIGDTESYQVYKGTVSEDDRVKAAVQSTAGEFISYQGGIVESLYAASDDIVMDAFQGGGMSQLGALEFAQQGYNYLQILGYYYPQTSLGRMVLEDGA